MKVYVVCPVRLGVSACASDYVVWLEQQGHVVFYPPRDVDQTKYSELQILEAERAAVIASDEVHVIYDATSQGSFFDLGMAYAMRKVIKIVQVIKSDTKRYRGRTYLAALRDRERTGAL